MIKGVSQMFSKEGTPKGYAFFSKNIIISQTLDEIINEKGTGLIAALENSNIKELCGLISHNNQIIIFYIDNINNDVISIYDEDADTFTVKVTRTDFDFSSDFPITGNAKLNSKGQTIVAFTDYNVTPKYVNLDTASPSDDLKIYNLALIATNPSITHEVVEGGGSLKTGVYFLVLQSEDINKNASNYSNLSSPVYITNHNALGSFSTTQGSAAGEISNKGIKFTLTDIDTSFKRLRAILISKIDDVVTVATYKTIEISSSTISLLITGTEVATVLDISEVLTLNQVFKKIKHLEVLNDQLFAADFVNLDITDFQNIANRIKLEWTSIPKYDAVSDQNAVSPIRKAGNNQKTFIHDEVYAMYAQIERLDGTFTQWFHIPGRELTAGHRASSSISNSIKFNGNIPKLFQLECTCQLNGVIGGLNDVPTETYAYGNFGVWENEDETYPSNFPDFAGQKVRHHRFPSLEWLRTNVYSSAPSVNAYMVSMWDMLGIKYSFNLTDLDTNLLSQIKSIRIGYAKRDTGNISVLGYDAVQLAAYPENGPEIFDNTIISSSGGNWRIAAQALNNDLMATNQFLRLHSPDVMILKPSIDNIYLANQLRLKISDLDKSFWDTDTDKPYGYLTRGGLFADVYTYVSNFIAADALNTYSSLTKYMLLENTRYLAPNTTTSGPDGTLNNSLSEECVHAKLHLGATLSINIPGIGGPTNAFQIDEGVTNASPGLWEETALSAIKVPKTNFFINYTDQVIIPITAKLDPTSFAGKLSGEGDAFICVHSFITMASAPILDNTAFNLTSTDGVRCVKVFLCESRYNLNERYVTQGDYNTYFYPGGVFGRQVQEATYWFISLDQLNCPVNRIQLSKSFNAINDFEQYGIYNHTATYQSEVPYGIARAVKASRSTDFEDGWRKFKPNDIFYTIRNKGRISNLVAWGSDKLLIHHERTLLVTRDKAVLQTDITQISLGSGDLFTIEPQELIPTGYGFGGTQHKFGCLLFEGGYAFVDQHTGEVLLYREGNTYKNIGNGFKNLFRDVLRDLVVGDNPYKETTGSIVLGFNKRTYSLLLSLKADSIKFSASFDLLKEEWVGFKDYIPDGMITTRNGLYSFKLNHFYKHNTGKYGEFYGVIYPSFVDIIINDEPETEKILAAIEWITRVENAGVVKPNETITSVTIWNDSFCTGKIDINLLTNLADYEDKNSKNNDRTWRFNKINDVVKDVDLPFVGGIFDDYRPITSNLADDLAWFDKSQVRGKYFIVRLEYSNIEDKLVSLRALIPNIKKSSV